MMLIDDNKIDLFISKRIIKKFNPEIEVSSFSGPVQAIQYFDGLITQNSQKQFQEQFTILLDINMPILNGFQLIEIFESMELFNHFSLFIYMLSSSLNLEDINRAKNHMRCEDYILKPLTIDKLKTIINSPTKRTLTS
jgi:CheY-like chemotaxis protein